MKREEDDEKERSPGIPLDLEVAILSRLPGKSLMKFRCVSKSWSSITRTQRFVDSYLAVSSAERSRFIIAVSNGVFAKGDAKRLLIFSSSYEGVETRLDMEIPSASLDHASKCASVHGFVGFRNGGQFLVCNPSTGKVVTLPCNGSRTSFGYDPVDNLFKALTLVTPPYQCHHDFLVHEVLTLGGGGGGEGSWSINKVTSLPYFPVTEGLCIGGFVYQCAWAPRHRMDPVVVCFDVRYERLSLIKAPRDVVVWESGSLLIEYNGKFGCIVLTNNPLAPLSPSSRSFDLWVLEDVEKQDWSKQTFDLPFSLVNMTSPGTNEAGEIIFAPKSLSPIVQPFYVYYYNVQRKDMRSVRLQGIADDEGFRRRFGLVDECFVSISPKHVESIASL